MRVVLPLVLNNLDLIYTFYESIVKRLFCHLE
jgi:hypothetical protein